MLLLVATEDLVQSYTRWYTRCVLLFSEGVVLFCDCVLRRVPLPAPITPDLMASFTNHPRRHPHPPAPLPIPHLHLYPLPAVFERFCRGYNRVPWYLTCVFTQQVFRNLKESAIKGLADIFKVDLPTLQVMSVYVRVSVCLSVCARVVSCLAILNGMRASLRTVLLLSFE